MNENEIIKNENNLDKVVRMHTHDLVKIYFPLNVSRLKYF